MYQNKLILLTILQVFCSITGSEITADTKKVVCYYRGSKGTNVKTLRPEGIDASLCTHIVLMRGIINKNPEGIIIMSSSGRGRSDEVRYPQRLVNLKEVNPNLKLLLWVAPVNIQWALENARRRTKIIERAVTLLRTTGFDGLEFQTPLHASETEALSVFLCEMHAEFDKFGYTVSTLASGDLEAISLESVAERMTRCCSYFSLLTVVDFSKGFSRTQLVAPMNLTRTMVNRYVERGYPTNKLVTILSTVGAIMTLADPRVTGVGVNIQGAGVNSIIPYDQMQRRLNDTNEGWTIVRGEEADSPYAYSRTGKWASFEDPISAAAKARFILDNNLGGALFFMIDMSDFDGISGKTFPIIRAVSDTFKQAALRGNDAS